MNRDWPLNQISENLLLAAKYGEATHEIRDDLNAFDVFTLKKILRDDAARKSFWINIYNAFYLILRKELSVSKKKVYTARNLSVGQQRFSLDDIEHGILRRNKFKYSLGLFANPFASKVTRLLAVSELDYRIHFALNCGARSCPPIAFYKAEEIDSQLDQATYSYLNSMTSFDDERMRVYIPRLFLWYRYDFNAGSGIVKIYREFLDRDISEYSIRYAKYDWTDDLDNFLESQ